MAYSISTGLGNGENRLFPVTFPYIDKSHVKVYVDGVETSAFTWFNDSTIQLNSAPANGVIVRIQRDTPKSTTAVDFTTGSMLKESTLDLNSEVLLYIVQEGFDAQAKALGPDASLAKWDAQNKVLANLANPVNPQDAVTKSWAEAIPNTTLAESLAAAQAAAAAQEAAETAAANAAVVTAGLSDRIAAVETGKLNATDFTRANLGAAASGANSDITEISGLTTPLSVAQGGTGRTTAVPDSSALAVMYALLYCRSESRASGPIPYGYLFPLITDELATKTGAAYDASGKYYTNAGALTVTAAQSSSTGSYSFYTDIDDLWDGDTVQCFYTAASGATINIDFGAGGAQALNKWTMTHYSGGASVPHSTTWTGAGAHRYWRLRFTAAMNNGTGTVAWVIEYSDDNTAWTAASSAVSYTENSQVVSCAVEAQGDMTLIPAAVTTASHPSSVTVRFLHKAVDATTYGTDLKARVSTDGGSNWSSYGTITKLCAYDADYDLLEAVFDTSALTGTSLKAEISTYNTKSQRVAGIALGYAA